MYKGQAKLQKSLVVILLLALACFAQENEEKNRITPTPDPSSRSKVYIPKDLEDSFVELEKMLHPSLISEMKALTEDQMISYHDNLGRWMRNEWGLWSGWRLAEYFNQLGIFHPDDMSGIILSSFWRHLNSQPIKLDEQVEKTKKYWKDAEEKETSISPVSREALDTPLKTHTGETIKLSQFAGRVVVLTWWSVHCIPKEACDLLTPLVEFKKEFADRGVEVIGLTGIYPEDDKKFQRMVKRVVKKYKINFPVVWDDSEFSNDVVEYEKFGFNSEPQVFVISTDGYVVKRIRGFNPRTDPAVLRDAVLKALENRSQKAEEKRAHGKN